MHTLPAVQLKRTAAAASRSCKITRCTPEQVEHIVLDEQSTRLREVVMMKWTRQEGRNIVLISVI